MFKRILIANRGEIAARVIRTCKQLGISTVAVYSEADREAPYVAEADFACLIGPPPASESYLIGQKLIDAAIKFGAEAIHPGYGFLSENAEFAKLCAKNKIAFIGPSPEAINAMGSKIESKRIASDAGVPMIPGYFGDDQDEKVLKKAAEEVGVPLLIKASAGGGGRGMRLVEDMAEFENALSLARSEAQSAFGDDRVLIERFITEPRHIEVQLMGDKKGNLVHLFERECSIQRNYQKVIEEAPAANMSDEIRTNLYDYALRLGSAMKYDSAGTLEFILDNNTGEVFFLEMNTRLQVEHPVTEEITGLDLVELQLKAASGEELGLSQDDITQSGWAIEARVNAENPEAGYMPQTGTLNVYEEPTGEGIRVDSGVKQGSEITPNYDSMIAKIIAHGPNRKTATRRLNAALGKLTIVGLGTNVPFMRDILSHSNFSDEPLTTKFIERTFKDGWSAKQPDTDIAPAIAAAAWLYKTEGLSSRSEQTKSHMSPWQSLGQWRVLHNAGSVGKTPLVLEQTDGSKLNVEVRGSAGNYVAVENEQEHPIHISETKNGDLAAEIDGTFHKFGIHFNDRTINLINDGNEYQYRILTIEEAYLPDGSGSGSDENNISAPMPGLVASIEVKAGQEVKSGDVIVVLEAMKLMQNLTASNDGTVKEVFCKTGDTVDGGTLLVEIEANTGEE